MTKLSRKWIPLFAFVLLTPLAARAAMVDPQSIELNGFFRFDHASSTIERDPPLDDIDIGRTIFDLEPGIGYFFNSNWELLGSLMILHESQGDLDDDHFGLKADGLYHFNTTGTVIPFAGVGLGFLTNGGELNGDNTSIIVPELLVGVRWPFKNIVSFNFTGGYRHITNFRGSDESGDSFFLGAGFSVFLRGGAQ
jgi:hypothetical protein